MRATLVDRTNGRKHTTVESTTESSALSSRHKIRVPQRYLAGRTTSWSTMDRGVTTVHGSDVGMCRHEDQQRVVQCRAVGLQLGRRWVNGEMETHKSHANFSSLTDAVGSQKIDGSVIQSSSSVFDGSLPPGHVGSRKQEADMRSGWHGNPTHGNSKRKTPKSWTPRLVVLKISRLSTQISEAPQGSRSAHGL